MTKILENLVDVKNILYPVLGEFQSKHYFSSYYGFFKDGVLFALYKEGKLFFRLSEEHLSEISDTYQLIDSSLTMKAKHFYFIPSDIYENLTQYSHWFSYIKRNNKPPRKKIRHIINMNLNLERLLYRNGIKTIDDFFLLGEINIFVQLIKNGEDINETLLFKLYAARKHKIVYNLSEQEKKQLLLEADNALYNAGLRKRFMNKY